jgi:hypothetical protein
MYPRLLAALMSACALAGIVWRVCSILAPTNRDIRTAPARTSSNEQATSARVAITTATTVWGFIWAFGFSIESFFEPAAGWLVIGASTGFIAAALIRCIRSGFRPLLLVSVVLSWSVGSIIGASYAGYDVLTCWLITAAIGGAVTAITAFGVGQSTRWTAAAAVWIVSSALGTLVALKGGYVVAPVIGRVIGGVGAHWSFGGRFAWFVCWGAGGIIAGAISTFAFVQLSRTVVPGFTSNRQQ